LPLEKPSLEERLRRFVCFVMDGSLKAFIAGIPFAANGYESLVHGPQLRFTLGVPAARSVISTLEQARDELVVKINQWKKARLFETMLPLVLAAVLQNAKTPAQVFAVAMQMRQSQSAKAFRKWTAQIDAEKNISAIDEKMREVKSYVDKLTRELDVRTKISHQITIIPAFYTIGIEKKGPAFLDRDVLGNTHLVFLTELFKPTAIVSSLEEKVVKLFDLEVVRDFPTVGAATRK